MVEAVERIAIARPCGVVFDLVTDLALMPTWRTTVLSAEWEDDGPGRVGRGMRATTKVAGRRFSWACEVTEWQPGARFGYVARGLDNRQEVAVVFDLEPHTQGCVLTMTGTADIPQRIAGIAGPLIVRLLIRENRAAMRRLKVIAEGRE